VIGVRVTRAHLGYNPLDWRWGVPPFGAALSVVAKHLCELREVHIKTEAHRYGHRVVIEAIRRKLHAAIKPLVQVNTLGGSKNPALIVGVVRDSKYRAAGEEKVAMAWYSYQQSDAIDDLDIEVRVAGSAAGNPMALLPAIRRVVREMDANIPLDKPQVLSEAFRESYLMPALFARLAALFGGLAALLVAIGLYGTLAYRVNRRTAEIGVRMALGAVRSQVLWMVLRDSSYLVAAGLVIGMPLAWFASKLMESMLYQTSAHDPVSLIVAGIGVVVVSVAAALIPARRAASVEPMNALRTE
jgi:hypothetical protein